MQSPVTISNWLRAQRSAHDSCTNLLVYPSYTWHPSVDYTLYQYFMIMVNNIFPSLSQTESSRQPLWPSGQMIVVCTIDVFKRTRIGFNNYFQKNLEIYCCIMVSGDQSAVDVFCFFL